jgi:hypothetical protein
MENKKEQDAVTARGNALRDVPYDTYSPIRIKVQDACHRMYVERLALYEQAYGVLDDCAKQLLDSGRPLLSASVLKEADRLYKALKTLGAIEKRLRREFKY